jgi:hypothetical protein
MKNSFLLDFQNIEAKYNEICRERNVILDKMSELEKNDIIKEYMGLYLKNEDLFKKLCSMKEKYIKLKQKNCDHLLWYFMSEFSDSYEGRRYFTCKCFECGLVEEKRSRDFNNVIVGDYNKLKEEYDNMEVLPKVKVLKMMKNAEHKN